MALIGGCCNREIINLNKMYESFPISHAVSIQGTEALGGVNTPPGDSSGYEGPERFATIIFSASPVVVVRNKKNIAETPRPSVPDNYLT